MCRVSEAPHCSHQQRPLWVRGFTARSRRQQCQPRHVAMKTGTMECTTPAQALQQEARIIPVAGNDALLTFLCTRAMDFDLRCWGVIAARRADLAGRACLAGGLHCPWNQGLKILVAVAPPGTAHCSFFICAASRSRLHLPYIVASMACATHVLQVVGSILLFLGSETISAGAMNIMAAIS